MVIAVILIAVFFEFWTRLLAERGDFSRCETRSEIQRALLWRITWRSILIWILCSRFLGQYIVLYPIFWLYLFYRTWAISRWSSFAEKNGNINDNKEGSGHKYDEEELKDPPGSRRASLDSNEEKMYADILGLEGRNTKEEIKRKYREMVAKYHPDKVEHLGDEFKEMAQKKLKNINKAYSYFKKKYNIS